MGIIVLMVVGAAAGFIATRLKQFDLNLTHLTLPEIRDFNALDDR